MSTTTTTQTPIPGCDVLAHRQPHEFGPRMSMLVTWQEADAAWVAGFAKPSEAMEFARLLDKDTRTRDVARADISIVDLFERDEAFEYAQRDDEEQIHRDVAESWQQGQTVTGPFGGGR